jgi:peptidoglycan/xylan/chitin deacetylase (PgdA/CDA1 family)
MIALQPKWRRNLTLGASCILGGEALRQGFLLEDVGLGFCLGGLSSVPLLLPALVRNCEWFGPVLKHFSPEGRQVWLTIDDGPDPHDTPEILDVLAQYEARATFFSIGKKILRWPTLSSAVLQAGHAVQCHTFTHPAKSFWAAFPKHARQEIQRGVEAVRSATGVLPTQLRAPVGLGNLFVHAAAEAAGLKMIGWSSAGLDGIHHAPERVLGRIFSTVEPGSIIVLHEGPLFGLRPGTRARTLEAVLKGLKTRGYQTVIPTFTSP